MRSWGAVTGTDKRVLEGEVSDGVLIGGKGMMR